MKTRPKSMTSGTPGYICTSPRTFKEGFEPVPKVQKFNEQQHTGKTAINNVNTIDECRSKIVRNRVFEPDWRKKAIKTLFLMIFIVKSVFDYRLPVVDNKRNIYLEYDTPFKFVRGIEGAQTYQGISLHLSQ